MNYVVYVDKPDSKALVHEAACRYYFNRKTTIPEDGGWSTLFRSKEEALAFATSTGMHDARLAMRCCDP